jgi:hypothetical protein
MGQEWREVGGWKGRCADGEEIGGGKTRSAGWKGSKIPGCHVQENI